MQKDNMLSASRKFANVMKELYDGQKIIVELNYSFEDMMASNESRLKFINETFDFLSQENQEYAESFEKHIEFIRSFLNGDFKETIAIDKLYDDDKFDCLIIPSQDQIKDLYLLIEMNMMLYNCFYKDNTYTIKLPDDSFNMNMTRDLTVHHRNLAHLFGLTQSEPEEDENKNLLKKYYLQNFDSGEEVADSIKLLNWFISDEGKKEVYRLNQLTLDFVKKHKSKFPASYDENGNIKKDSLDDFKRQFKEETGLNYPILRFSRYVSKCINNLNYFNMTNISQMILDYNAPIGEQDEKDIFIVNAPESKLLKSVEDYYTLIGKLEESFKHYGKTPQINKEIEEFLFSIFITSKKNKGSKEEEIRSFLNLFQTYDFVGRHNITPNNSKMEEKFREFLKHFYDIDISLIGFGTDFEKDEQGRTILTNLETHTTNSSHCDTSIAITPVDLVGKYYERGRAFFIDVIFSGGGYARISTPMEEINYLRMREYLDEKVNEKISCLDNLIQQFDEKYKNYKNHKKKK